MSKGDIEFGSSKIQDFFNWISERTAIWHRRFVQKMPKPWTQDDILLDYKFTNAFRQLDRGTIALQTMLQDGWSNTSGDGLKATVFNIMWYRLFNLDSHAKDVGWQVTVEGVMDPLYKLHAEGKKVFTSAHMTTGCEGEDKIDTYHRAVQEVFDDAQVVVDACKTGSMEIVFETLKQFYMIGPFVAYEMVCDLRFTPLLSGTDEKLTWANVGPGAKRGMQRLGLEPSIVSMRALYHLARGQCDLMTKALRIDVKDEVMKVHTDTKSLLRHPYVKGEVIIKDEDGNTHDQNHDFSPLFEKNVDYVIFNDKDHPDWTWIAWQKHEGPRFIRVDYSCDRPGMKLMSDAFIEGCRVTPLVLNEAMIGWPFELREIEHSLCEFDKYERVRTGVGRPRQKFNGRE